MNRTLKVLAFFLIWLAAAGQSAWSQTSIRLQEVSGPVVHVQGQPLLQPWVGGLNSPQFSAIDLNQDGQPDLFVFDRSSKQVTTFLAVQTNGQWRYQHAPQYEASFPRDLHAFALLRDYDRDGAPDLFTASNLGLKVYRNISAVTGRLAFEVAHPVLYYDTDINLLVGSEDLPALTDMDGDGDLDILMWEWSSGTKLEYFQNQQVEQNLSAGELKFTKVTNWWGQVTRCIGSCNSYKFNDHCPSAHHVGGSSILPLDVNGNGVIDLVVGHDDCPDLVSLMNTGTNLLPKVTSAVYNLPPDISGPQFSVFPAAYYLDITFDGVPDLVIAPNSTSNSHQNVNLRASVWFYANTGTAAQPRFEGAKQPFLQNQMLDVGEGASPAFGHLTGAAGPDLLIGNTAVLQGDQYAASLSLFQNKAVGQTSYFELVEDDYLNFSTQKLLNLKPQLVDLNSDGATDLVYSAYNQQAAAVELKYLLNQSVANQPAQFSVPAAVAITGVLFFRGDTPYLYDVSNDGKLDLLVGRASGALQYYRNSGSSLAPVWHLESEHLGGIAANTAKRRLQLHVADLNQDGQPDLLTSDDSGQLNVYPGFTAHLTGTFPVVEEVLWQPYLQQFGPVQFGHGMAMATAQLSQSSTLGLFIGTHAGGVRYLETVIGPLGSVEPKQTPENVQVYPNPAQGIVSLVTEKSTFYTLHNLAGVKVAEGKTNAQEIQPVSLQHLPAELYLVRFTFGNGQTVIKKLVVQR